MVLKTNTPDSWPDDNRKKPSADDLPEIGRVDAPPKEKPSTQLKKQISAFVPLADWILIRDESIRRGVSKTAIFMQWAEPHLAELREAAMSGDD